ncbi:unnamed protein product [Brassicogethes aeneus]|uniref:CCR4-NOT transcription complex subunit 9 n=1 Tax=Brassicogethes aeneus TaxID=1431903 RepID=A0A9P0BID7_BRAAE|nr:unnamed protein product [Brassicogethes aeneus]
MSDYVYGNENNHWNLFHRKYEDMRIRDGFLKYLRKFANNFMNKPLKKYKGLKRLVESSPFPNFALHVLYTPRMIENLVAILKQGHVIRKKHVVHAIRILFVLLKEPHPRSLLLKDDIPSILLPLLEVELIDDDVKKATLRLFRLLAINKDPETAEYITNTHAIWACLKIVHYSGNLNMYAIQIVKGILSTEQGLNYVSQNNINMRIVLHSLRQAVDTMELNETNADVLEKIIISYWFLNKSHLSWDLLEEYCPERFLNGNLQEFFDFNPDCKRFVEFVFVRVTYLLL